MLQIKSQRRFWEPCSRLTIEMECWENSYNRKTKSAFQHSFKLLNALAKITPKFVIYCDKWILQININVQTNEEISENKKINVLRQ